MVFYIKKYVIFAAPRYNILMTIDQIIEVESTNAGVIHLFRNGLFFRAFERSALSFLDIENYSIIKKHSVKLDIDYIYIGFPSAILDRVLDGRQYTKVSDDHIVVEARNITVEELEVKKSGYQIAEPKVIKSVPRRPSAIPNQEEMFASMSDISTPKSELMEDRHPCEIKDLIRAFDIDNSTPLMCQTFLLMIKEKIAL